MKNCLSLFSMCLFLAPSLVNAMELSNDRDPLLVALDKHEYQVAKILLESQSASVNACDNKGETALHKIANQPCFSPLLFNLASLLIKQGANIDAKSKADWYPTCFAAFWGNSEMVKLFVDNGACLHLTMSGPDEPGYHCTVEQFCRNWTAFGHFMTKNQFDDLLTGEIR
jgi:ankyrin repeat protein